MGGIHMFGLRKRKNEREYEDEYTYEDYEYEDDDEYEYEDEDYEYENEEEEEYQEEYQPARNKVARRSINKEGSREEYSRSQSHNERANVYQDEGRELRQEIIYLEENVHRLKSQLDQKQEELSKIAALLAEKENQVHSAGDVARKQAEQEMREMKKQADAMAVEIRKQSDAAINEVKKQAEARVKEERRQVEIVQQKMQRQMDELEEELIKWKQHAKKNVVDEDSIRRAYEEQIAEQKEKILELETSMLQKDEMKNDLADIIIETKEQSRNTVERAQWEADRIRERAEIDARKLLADASVGLRTLKQEAAQYRERLQVMKEESNILFDKLISSSEQVSQQEIQVL